MSTVLVVSVPQRSMPDPGPDFAFHAAEPTGPGVHQPPHSSLGVWSLSTIQVEARYNRQHKTNHRFSPKHCDDHQFSAQLLTQRKPPPLRSLLKALKWLMNQSTAWLLHLFAELTSSSLQSEVETNDFSFFFFQANSFFFFFTKRVSCVHVSSCSVM